MKINLGAGGGRMGDFLSVDLYHKDADVRIDLTKPLPYSDDSINEISSSHFIEHLSYHIWPEIIKDWFRVLKPGGLITLYCPDIEALAKRVIQGDREAIKNIYGWQKAEGEYHLNGFTLDWLKSDLENVGFEVKKAESISETANLHVVAIKHKNTT